jgi:hypothetical protein
MTFTAARLFVLNRSRQIALSAREYEAYHPA